MHIFVFQAYQVPSSDINWKTYIPQEKFHIHATELFCIGNKKMTKKKKNKNNGWCKNYYVTLSIIIIIKITSLVQHVNIDKYKRNG